MKGRPLRLEFPTTIACAAFLVSFKHFFDADLDLAHKTEGLVVEIAGIQSRMLREDFCLAAARIGGYEVP